MTSDRPKDLGLKYEPGSTTIDVIAGDNQQTLDPDEARDFAKRLEKQYTEQIAEPDSELAEFVADLEIAADRAERAQQDQ